MTSEFEGYQARDPNDGILVEQAKIQGFVVRLYIHILQVHGKA